MNLSFYSAAIGAGSQQAKLDVIANNIANISTTGFKRKAANFSDLMYTNMNAVPEQATNLVQGSGVRLNKVDLDYEPGAYTETGIGSDYAIMGSGFFKLYDPDSESYTYTRDGSFIMSLQNNGDFYLASNEGKWVMDPENRPLVVYNINDKPNIGVFDFNQKNGMQSEGENELQVVNKNGEELLVTDEKKVRQGMLESSNVDMAGEFTRVIETQRAYQYALRMVQTSDEVEGIYNALRQ